MKTEKIYQGNCIDVLKDFPDESIDCVCTSPPYWGLRDYGTAEWEGGDENCKHIKRTQKQGGEANRPSKELTIFQYDKVCKKCGAIRKDRQLGLEETPEEFVENLVKVFSEVKRVLKSTGTLWLNLGDSYFSAPAGNKNGIPKQNAYGGREDAAKSMFKASQVKGKKHNILKQKDLVGIPFRVAFALQADGWYLRQDIIWHKPNPMPESVQDRCTKSHEYIFLLTKSPKYFYDIDAIREKAITIPQKVNKTLSTKTKYGSVENEAKHRQGMHKERGESIVSTRPDLPEQDKFVDFIRNKSNAKKLSEDSGVKLSKVEHWFRYDESGFSYPSIEDWDIVREYLDDWSEDFKGIDEMMTKIELHNDSVNNNPKGANKRSVWTITTKPYKEAHFATFPIELPTYCIKAGCPEGGVVLDPFMGSGTTGLAARNQQRNYVGIDLNPEYIEIAERRLQQLNLFI